MNRIFSQKVTGISGASSLQEELLNIVNQREKQDKARDRKIWAYCSLKEYADSWRARINKMKEDPRLFVNQMDGSSLCGAASVVQNLLLHEPSKFVQFAMDLYSAGEATFAAPGAKSVTVPKNIAKADPHSTKNCPKDFDWLDWIVLSSIRSNVHSGLRGAVRQLFPLRKPVANGALGDFLHNSAIPGDVQEMYGMFGYGKDKILRDAHSLRRVDVDSTDDVYRQSKSTDSRTAQLTASRLFKEGRMISLFINSAIKRLDANASQTYSPAERQKELRKTEKDPNHHHSSATHWIVLTSEIRSEASTVEFKYIDYGAEKTLRVTQGQFTNHFYGYIAALPG